MNIKDILKFIKGGADTSVNAKGLNVATAYYRIHEGTIMSTNGVMTIKAKIPLDISCCPEAESFRKAIDICDSDDTDIYLTKTGKLTIKSGKFRAIIKNLPFDEFREPEYLYDDYEKVSISDSTIIDDLKWLIKYIGDDASRRWSNGIFIKGNKAYVTNNIILIEKELDFEINGAIAIPKSVIAELVNNKENPTYLYYNDNNIRLVYKGKKIIISQLLENKWPTNMAALFENFDRKKFFPIKKDLIEGTKTLVRFKVENITKLNIEKGTLTIINGNNEPIARVDLNKKIKLRFAVFNLKWFDYLITDFLYINYDYVDNGCLNFNGNKCRAVAMGIRTNSTKKV